MDRTAVFLSLFLVLTALHAQPGLYDKVPAGEVEEIQIGAQTMYRFTTAEGEVVVVDRPPAGFSRQSVSVAPGPDIDLYATAKRPDQPFDWRGVAKYLLDILMLLLPVAVLAGGFFIYQRWRRRGQAAPER